MKKKIELTAEIKYHLLKDISHKIRGTLDLDKILNLLLDSLENIIHYDAAGIFILRGDINHPTYHYGKQKITSIAERGFGNLPRESDAMLMEGKGIIGQTIKTAKSIILQDVKKDRLYIAGRKETQSEITCPIFRDGKTIGALNVLRYWIFLQKQFQFQLKELYCITRFLKRKKWKNSYSLPEIFRLTCYPILNLKFKATSFPVFAFLLMKLVGIILIT